MKKIITMGTIALTLGLSTISVFASPTNPGVPARDGSGGRFATVNGQTRVYDGLGIGQGGQGRGLGIGGMMLQDGSCYISE